MANNSYVNKVVFGSATLVDLTGTTATADKILQGYGAFGADGAWMDGTATSGGDGTINYFDYQEDEIVLNTYIDTSTGAEVAYNGWSSSPFIEVKPNTSYRFIYKASDGIWYSMSSRYSCEYNSSQQRVGAIDTRQAFTTSASTQYVRFSQNSSTATSLNWAHLMLVEADVATEYIGTQKDYVPYKDPINLQSKSVTYTPTARQQTEAITADSGYDGLDTVNIIVEPSKNTQVVQGTTRTTSSTLTAIGAEMTVSKTGTYNVYWSAFRSSTSSSYTYGTQLFIDGVAYGSENTTWSNHIQNNHLSNVSLTVNQKIRVRGRNSRGSSYYIYAPTLVIVEA